MILNKELHTSEHINGLGFAAENEAIPETRRSYESFYSNYPNVVKSFEGRHSEDCLNGQVRDLSNIPDNLVHVNTNSAATVRADCDVYTTGQFGCVTAYGFNGKEKLFGHITPNSSLGYKFRQRGSKAFTQEDQQKFVDSTVDRIMNLLKEKPGALEKFRMVLLVNLASEDGSDYDASVQERDWQRLKKSFERYDIQVGIAELPLANSAVLSSKENPEQLLIVGQEATVNANSGTVEFDKKDSNKGAAPFRVNLELASKITVFQKRVGKNTVNSTIAYGDDDLDKKSASQNIDMGF